MEYKYFKKLIEGSKLSKENVDYVLGLWVD